MPTMDPMPTVYLLPNGGPHAHGGPMLMVDFMPTVDPMPMVDFILVGNKIPIITIPIVY